jgi:hypothetical protein
MAPRRAPQGVNKLAVAGLIVKEQKAPVQPKGLSAVPLHQQNEKHNRGWSHRRLLRRRGFAD